ncbi:MAG TPA: NADH-quinone oxidoreductase subunit C, partial [Tepidiformaceae bacterium]|nr:NADH-quinone oxidoreductase subunit C [Tepidiformaceae bacterium]
MTEAQTTALPYPIGKQTPHEALEGPIAKALPGVTLSFGATATDLDVTVQPADLLTVVTALRDRPELAFDYLRNIAGVDYGEEGMALKYAFYSFTHGHALQVTVPTSAGHPHVPSLTSLYPAADWHEREAGEMFGFMFDGHPNQKNLLLEEDLHIHPLLKAHPLQPAEILQG